MAKRIVSFSDRCVGCRLCEIVCSVRFEGTVNPASSRIKVTRVEERAIDLPVVCLQCSDAPCSKACPVGAIDKSEASVLHISREECTGCGLCIDACPIGVMSLHYRTGVAIACDLCSMDPTCVKYCPTKAIEFTEVNVEEYEKIRPALADVEDLTPGSRRKALAKALGKAGKSPDPYDSDGYKSARKVVEQVFAKASRPSEQS